jgi:hypothetical protein
LSSSSKWTRRGAWFGEAALANVVTFVTDGAPWIWKRLDWIVTQVGLGPFRVVEVLDWCHAVHHVSVALAALSLADGQRTEFSNPFRRLLKKRIRIGLETRNARTSPR